VRLTIAGLFAAVLVFPAALLAQESQPSAQTPSPAAPDAAAQTAAPVPVAIASGAVHTSDGSPVPGATLRLVDTDTRKVFVSWTDESGKFEFPALPAGHYRVEATQLGFVTQSLELQLGGGPEPPPLQFVLRVATLAELSAAPDSGGTGHPSGRRFPPGAGPGAGAGAPSGSGQPSAGNGAGSGGAPGGRGRGAGRGQPLPPGIVNAMSAGLAQGGFQQTDLAGEAGAGQGNEAAGQNPGAQANLATSGGAGSSSDSFLLQGTVGQGLSGGGFGGPGGFNVADAVAAMGLNNQGQGGPGAPGIPGAQGGAGGFGQQGGLFPGGGGGFPGGPGGRGGPNGNIGRLLRQQVNRVRFTVFDRYTNSVFNARPFSITGVNSPKVGTYDERVGGTMGGPLKIPHIYNGSDKTYFFANYQHEIAKNGVNTFSTVPTLDQRNGFFCIAPPTGMNPLTPTLVEPFSSILFPTVGDSNCQSAFAQQIPASDFENNKAVQGLLGFIPKPNLTSTNGSQNYLLQSSTPLNADTFSTQVLHTINAKFNVNGGYNFNSQRSNTLSNFVGIGGTSSTRNQSVDLGLSHNWSSHVVESMHLNWSRTRLELLSDNSFGTDIAANLGIMGASTLPIDFGIPQLSFSNFSGTNDPIPTLTRNQTLRFSDGVTWTHLKHTMTFGGEIRRIQLNTQSNPTPRGGFVFTGLATGVDFADFLLDVPFNTTVQFGNPNLYLRSWGFAAYGQDDWRVSKTFTLQYGLRYEAVTPPADINNNLVNLDITDLSNVTKVAHLPDLSAPGLPHALIHGRYGNLEPRIGIAWQPTFIKKYTKHTTVIRAGYSIFYNESIYNTLARELAYQSPVSTVQNLTTTSTAPLNFETGLVPEQPTGFIANTESVDPNYKNGYAQLWNLGTETTISPSWVLDLTYTGTKGTNLDILRAPNRAPLGTPSDEIQANRIDKNATGYTFDQSGANSIYNALQVRLMHRFTHGVMLQGIYTYGKSLDDSSSIGGGAATVEQQDGNLHAEYGLSTFDVRHQLRAISMWELPFGQRTRLANHGWKEHVFGDWRLQNIFTWQTGTPSTVLLGGVASDNGTGVNFSLRPDLTGDPNMGMCGGSTKNFFNTGAFTLPTDSDGNLTYGDEPRGAVEGPCSFNWNLSLAKTFRFGPDRRHQLNISWQVNNLTNTVNYNGIGTVLPCSGTPGTGATGNAAGITCGPNVGTGTESTFSLFGRVTSAASMRTMAVQARFNF
jgi:trimeric autotransporter adhesin